MVEAINVYSVPIYKHNEVSGVLFVTFIQISYQVFCRLQLIIMLAMHLFLMKMVMLF